jgi:hypothetical protein
MFDETSSPASPHLIIDLGRPMTVYIRPTEERGLAVDPEAREALMASTRLEEGKFVALVSVIYVIATLWFIEKRENLDNQADTDRIRKALRLFRRGASVLSELSDAKLEGVASRLGIDHHRLSLSTEAALMKSLQVSRIHFPRRAGGKSEVEDCTMRASDRLLTAWETVTGQPADQRQYDGSMRDVYWKLMTEMRIKHQELSITPVIGNPKRFLVDTPLWDCSAFRDACKEDLLKAVVRREDRFRKTASK